MPSFKRPAAEESILPSYSSSQGSSTSTQAGSGPSEPPPAYALHIPTRPPGILSSLLPRRIRSRLLGGASPLSEHPHGPCSQADTPPSGPASDQKPLSGASPLPDHPHGPCSQAETPSGSASDQKPPVAPQSRPCCVQVCPHEVLSFERFQRILSLPGFKGSYKKLNALSAGPDHELEYSDSNNRECKPRPIKLGGLHSSSDYSLSAKRLVLTTRWYIPTPKESHYSSKSALQEYLQDLDIKLCPHKNFDDPWIVEVLYRTAHPKEKLADPLDQWEVDAKFPIEAGGTCEAQCQLCSTSFRMSTCGTLHFLYVTRDLGKGTSSSDPVWLAQCSVAAEEERGK